MQAVEPATAAQPVQAKLLAPPLGETTRGTPPPARRACHAGGLRRGRPMVQVAGFPCTGAAMRRFAATQTAAALTAALAAAGTAHAQSAPGSGSIWTFQVENDAVSTLSGTSDQYYTSGLRLGWTSGADAT